MARCASAAEVREGTYHDALRVALGANASHGLRRTNADKQYAMEVAWANRFELFPACIIKGVPRKAGNPSARQLASLCGVSFGNAVNFLEKTKDVQLNTSPSLPPATTVTTDHLEERNENVRWQYFS